MTAITTLLATIVLIGLYTAIDILFSKQVFWVKNAAFAVFSFFGTFCIVSGILFAVNLYSFWLTYSICFGAGVAAAGVIIRKEKTNLTLTLRNIPQFREYPQYFWRCLIALLVLGFIVSAAKHEFYGMGQDQGVYQTAGIYRTAGYNDVQIDLPGYHALSNEADRELYRNVINRARTSRETEPEERTQIGFYSVFSQFHLYFEPQSEVAGFLHGIPNLGAMLSISGRIFGSAGMTHINTLFLLAGIVLLFLTMNYNLKLKVSTSTFMTALFVFSPIVVWTTKSALAESYLVLIMIVFFYLITSKHRHARWLLWLPVVVFAFYHVSLYTMMPIFLLVFLLMYMQTRESSIFISGLISLAGYFGGFFTMVRSANGYTVSNYINSVRGIIGDVEINYPGFLMFIFCVTLIVTILFALACYIVKRWDIKLRSDIFLVICKYAMLAISACCVLIWAYMYFHDRIPPTFSMILEFFIRTLNRTITAYIIMTGFITLPLVLYLIFKKDKKLSDKNTNMLVVMFIYCILVYSTFLRPRLDYYYYYARYLAPFIPIIPILAGVYIDKLKPKYNVIIAAVAIASIAPLTFFMTLQKDHSRLYWKGFQQVVSAINELNEDDVVIVAQEAMTYFFLPLNAMTDSIILPEAAGEYQMVNDMINDPNRADVYYLSIYGGDDPYFLSVYEVDVVYDGFRSDSSRVFPARGRVSLPGFIPPIPLNLEPSRFGIYLTEVTDMDLLMQINSHYFDN